MWEQIRANQRKSIILIVVMALLLIALGSMIGMVAVPNSGGAIMGALIAAIIWLFMTLIAWSSGGKLLMQVSKAKRIEKKDHPQLWNVVEEMTIAAGMAKMPAVYIIDDMSLNAFATGRDPDHAAVAVTAGLLGSLNRDELQGVIAHEMSHVKNRDILFMTMIGIMVGAIVLISEVFLRSLWFSGGGRRRSRNSSKDGNQLQLILMIVAIVFAILAPILAYVIYFASSRKREYLADAGGALLTRYPEGLASALEKISRDGKKMEAVSKATAPMYIENPMQRRAAAGLGSTHPPIKERIRILRSMAGNASYDSYQQAWNKVGGSDAGQLPASALAGSRAVKTREADPEAAKVQTRKQLRQATDLLRKANRFLFLTCACGLKLKLPPEFKRDHIQCPRCSRDLKVPVAQLAAMSQITDVIDKQGKI